MKMAKWIKEAAVAAAVIGAGIGGGMATAEAADVAQIGTVGYETIAEALSAAGSGDTITLLADIALASTVTIDKDVTIDLNGNDIGATGCRALWIKAGTVGITGEGTVSANGEGLDETGSVIRVGDAVANEAAAKLTVGEDVTVSSSKSYGITTFGKNSGGIALDVYGTVAVTSGGGADAAISGNGNGGLSAVAITIRDGAVVSATNGAAIFFPGAGTLAIEGGDVTGPTAVYAKSGSVTVSGGTLRGTGAAAAYQYKGDGLVATGDALVIDTCGYPNGNPAATVTGGTLVSANGKAVASYAKDETYTALEDIIPPTSAALFGDAESDGVPAGYVLTEVEGSDPVLYAVTALAPIQYFNTWSVPNAFYFDDEDPIPARTTQGTVPTIKRTGDTSYHAAEEWVEMAWTVTASTATDASTPDDTIATVDADGLVTFSQPGTVKVWLTMTDPSGASKSGYKTVKYDLAPAYVVSADGQTKTAYGSLYGAFNAAQDGETVVLGKDGTGNNLSKMTLDADKAITLDLNGHTFTFSQNYRADAFGALITVKQGSLTVVDSGETKGGIVVSGTNARAFNMDCEGNTAATDAVLTIGEGVNVSSASDCCVTVFGLCTLNTEGNLASPNDFAIAGNGTASCAGTVINVTGGTVTGDEVAIYQPQDGILNITGGTVTGGTAVYVKSGEINVSGGTLVGTGDAAGYAYNGNGANATGDALVIDNCGYPGGVPAASITGGTFVSANAQSVASYVATDDAGYTGGGSFEKVDDFIATTVDGGANPALFSDADADGVPAGYVLTAVEGTDPVLYAVTALAPIQYYNTWSVPNVFYFDDEDPIPARTTQGTVPTIKRVGDTAYHAAEEWVEISWTVTASTATNASTPDDTIATVDADGLVTFTQPGTVKVWLTMTDPSGAAKSSSKTVKYDLAPAYVVSADGQTKTAYGSLYGAFNAAQDGETVVLGKDGTGNNLSKMTLNADKAIALDLNGHTFTFSANYRADGFGAFITVQKGSLTVVDTGETKGGIVVSGTNARAFNMDCETNAAATDAVLTIGEGVNVSSASDCCVTVFGPCTLNTEGNLTSPNDFAIAGNGTASCAGTVINVTGGTVTGGEVGIYHPQDGVLNISGGTITGATAVYVKAGEINVSGGTLVGTGAAAGYAYNGNGANATGDALVIDNCGYPGGVPAASITGGTFVSENAQSVASYVATDDAGYAGGGSFEKVDGFIAATVDGGANPALFSDAEADGVPEGYALVESETAGLYRIEKLWTVTFIDEDGTELSTADYPYGTEAAAIVQPDEPTKEADAQYTYAFAGWDPEVADVTTNATYKATYSFTTNAYEVAFEWHGDSFATNYPYGTAAADVAVPDDPENYTENGTNYAFTGWSPAAVADVTTNATYTAQYGIVPEVDVSCVVTANGDDDEMTLVLAGPDDCDGVADVAIYEWDNTGAEPVPGEVVWSTNGVALAEGAAELTVSIDTGVVLPGQLVVAAYLPNDKYSGATASNRVMGTSSIILTTESNYQVDDNIVLGLEAYNSTGDIAVTLWVSDGNGGLTEFDRECVVVENTVEVGELPAGEYVVTAVLAEDANYLGSTDTKSFRVDKLEPGLEAEAGETTEGEPVVVTATLGYDDCTGTVTVAVDGSEYVGDVLDGVAAVIISNLAAGDYEATVTYSGDDKYLEASTNFTIKVAAARPYEEVDGVIWYYEPVGTNAMVTGIAEAHATGNLTMPETLGGWTVTEVGTGAFLECTNITGMAIAAGVTNIMGDAFASCTGLTDMTIPDLVANIGDYAFGGCSGLTNVTIGAGVTNIEQSAFYECMILAAVSLPEGLVSIGDFAFEHNALTDLRIPDSVADIGKRAFDQAGFLTNVWLGTGIESVGENAFATCPYLATVWAPVEQEGTGLLDAAGLPAGCEIHYYGTQVVKFDANGGTCDVKTNGYTIGEAYGWLPEAEREGYDLTGWWDEAEGVQLATNDTVTEYASRTVYARWALQPGLTVTAGRGGSVLAVIGGRTNVVEGGTTAILRVPRGAAFSVTAVPASGFALGPEGGTGHVEYDSIEEEGVEVSFAFTPNPAGTLYWKYARNANGWFCAQIAFPWHEGYGEALGNLRFLFADRVDAEGNRSAYLVDTSTAFVPLDTVEILETDEYPDGLELRAAAIDTSEFASLRDGAWAIYGVGDATLGTELASVPAGECKIALRVVNRNIGTVEPLHGAIGYLAWDDEDGATYVLPVVPNEGAVAAGNRLLLESALVFGPIEDIPQDGKPVDPSDASRYTIVFNANGGTGAMANQKVAYGTTAALRKNAFTRSGWVFLGWSKTKDGAVAYADGATVRNLAAAGKTVTLYAKWSTQYTVVFNANGGKGTMAKQTMAYGTAAKLRKNAFTRSGWVFAGWAKTKDGAVAYADGATVKNLAAAGKTATLYAKWAKKTYTVAFNANGGKGTMAKQTMTYGKAAKLRKNAFTRSGWVFAGWAKTKTGAVAYKNQQSVKNLRTDGKTTTLYAKWAKKTYTVEFVANGGTGKMSKQSMTYGTAKALSANRFTRSGWTFAGWARTAGGAKAYGDKQSVKNLTANGGTVKLYALWTANKASASKNAAEKKGAVNAEPTAAVPEPADVDVPALEEADGAWMETTTSDGSDGAAVADGDEETAWVPEGTGWAWVVLTFPETLDVADVEVAGDNLPEGLRILISEDADEWLEETAGKAQYVWVAFPVGEEPPAVREIRVIEEEFPARE